MARKYVSKELLAVEQGIASLDDNYGDSAHVSRLIYEDKRRKLTGARDQIIKKRNRASLYFVIGLVVIFVVTFYLGTTV